MSLSNRTSVAIPVRENSQVGEARRAAKRLGREAGLDESRQSDFAIVVTELSKNLVSHAQEGIIVLRAIDEESVPGAEVLALDSGPGIANLPRALEDGYSTAGTPGHGLGAARRLANEWDMYSVERAGSAFMARVWQDKPPPGPMEIGAVNVPLPSETVSGDSWAVRHERSITYLMVIDGLGHGAFAAEAAKEGLAFFKSWKPGPLPELMRDVHANLRKTRGAAGSVAKIDAAAGTIHYVGVGNISASVCHGMSRKSMISLNGTLGHEIRRIQEYAYTFPADASLVVASDGLATHWQLDRYPGLAGRTSSVVAGVLYRDHRRGRDDVTVVVARRRASS